MNAAHTLTIATYNICHGRYADFDWERIAAPIRSVGADLVGIQEVDMFTRRSHRMDTLRALADATGLSHAVFVPTMDYDGGKYGTAILSRYPIEESRVFPLPAEGLEPRAVGCARVTLPDGAPLWFVNTHLSYKSAAVRRAQLGVLQQTLYSLLPNAALCDASVVITGDFNTEEPLTPVVDADFGDINGDGRYRTFSDPAIAIDRILYTHATLSPANHGMVESNASDHHMLWARFSRAQSDV